MEHNALEIFKEKMTGDEMCLGMVVTLADPVVSELAGKVGWDFTWLDMEHAPLTIETALKHTMALNGSDTAPLIRVPDNYAPTIKPLLDLAPAGVIVPMVNSANDAAKAVAACRYPPRGSRGVGPRRGMGYGTMDLNDYFACSRTDPMVIVQVEDYRAVDNIDEILSVGGVDSICVGPCDLAASMGKLDDMNHSEVVAAIDRVSTKTKAAGKLLGSAVGGTAEVIGQWRNRGADWLAVAVDWACIAGSSKEILQREKK